MNTKNIEVGQTLYLPIERAVRFVPCIVGYKEIKVVKLNKRSFRCDNNESYYYDSLIQRDGSAKSPNALLEVSKEERMTAYNNFEAYNYTMKLFNLVESKNLLPIFKLLQNASAKDKLHIKEALVVINSIKDKK